MSEYQVPDLDINGDATDQLTAWLDSLPPGATADLRGNTYLSERPIKLLDKQGLTVRNGHLIREDLEHHGGVKRPFPNPHLWFLRASDCHVADMTMTGTNQVSDTTNTPWSGAYLADHELEAAVRFENFVNVSAKRVTADGVWGDGIHAHGGDGAWLEEINVVRNGRQGIVPNGINITVINCAISSRRAGIDLEPNWAHSVFGGVLIKGNTIRSRLLAITAGGLGDYSGGEICYNTILSTGIPAINVRSPHRGPRDRWWVHHNEIGAPGGWSVGSPENAIRFGNSVGSVVEWNYVNHGLNNSPERRRTVGLMERSLVAVRRNWFQGSSAPAYDRDGTCAFLEHDNHSGPEAPEGWPAVGAAASPA